ncbi:Mitochondrial GTPase 1 like protein [Verticillium longisporum]|nr:Mitochondrial GTPase 1 like protein [Verticillium longisporum]
MASASAAAAFVPRLRFPLSESIPRSYYLGHHHAGLREITNRLSSIGLVLECRDYRVPLTSWNPHLDRAVAGRNRIIVYTHRDLGIDSPHSVERDLRRYHAGHNAANSAVAGHRVVFWRKDDPSSTKALLRHVADAARAVDSLTGVRALVVGMPNVGKSTLLNRLRTHGMAKKASVARTGAQPGVTRKLSSPVRILEGGGSFARDAASSASSASSSDGGSSADGGSLGEGVFVLDTPGVFMPYVEDAEDMVKLALAGSYLPDIDGNSFSGRYRAFLLSSSMPLKSTIYAEWHDDRLVPWVHFVPFDNTYVDLYGIMDHFLRGRDAAAERIATDGKRWAETVLRREDMRLYVWRLLLEYARVMDDNRDRLAFVQDWID